VPVTVINPEGERVSFDNADGWILEITDNGTVLNVVKGSSADPTKVLASFNVADWSSVRKDPKKDTQLQFEEALELIKAVDDGNFGHQDKDWQERADSLLTSVKA
jgi:hypothetical protein